MTSSNKKSASSRRHDVHLDVDFWVDGFVLSAATPSSRDVSLDESLDFVPGFEVESSLAPGRGQKEMTRDRSRTPPRSGSKSRVTRNLEKVDTLTSSKTSKKSPKVRKSESPQRTTSSRSRSEEKGGGPLQAGFVAERSTTLHVHLSKDLSALQTTNRLRPGLRQEIPRVHPWNSLATRLLQ
jgi:hypothetical protein